MKRRDLLLAGGAAIATLGLGLRTQAGESFNLAAAEDGPFPLTPLPYAYDALEPVISEETMRFHHDKHYAGYTKNFNKAINKHPEFKELDAEVIIANLEALPTDIQRAVRNNGGGYVNHSIFWEVMASPDEGGGGQPQGALAVAIEREFGSIEAFQEQFNTVGAKQFGSGWSWLAFDPSSRKLVLVGLPNQDSPYMQGLYPILGNDVWEHAYYLTYRNRRKEYLTEWWKVVNWPEVSRRYNEALSWSPVEI